MTASRQAVAPALWQRNPNPFRDVLMTVETPAPKSHWMSWNGKGFYSLKDAKRSIRYPATLVRNVLPAHGVSFLNARRGTGKTLLAIDLGLHLATDRQWLGLPTVKGRTVIYVAGEDAHGVMQNVRAWQTYYKVTDEELEGRFIPYIESPDLMDEENTISFVQHVQAMEAFDPQGPGPLVVIDTWQRATASGEQNDDQDMQAAIRNAEMIGKRLNGAVLFLSHPPKNNDKSVMGSSIIENSSVAIWKLDHDGKVGGSNLKFEVTRIKNALGGSMRKLRIDTVQFPECDEHDEHRHGAFLVPNDPRSISETDHIRDGGFDNREKRIVQSIREKPELSYQKRAKELGIPKTTLITLVEKLHGQGAVQKLPNGKLTIVQLAAQSDKQFQLNGKGEWGRETSSLPT